MTEIFNERLEMLAFNPKNKSGKSNKFYQIVVEGRNDLSVYNETRRWGKYGTKGQVKIITHYGEWSALSSARSMIAKKKSKGYTKPIAALVRLATAMDD